MSEIYQPLYEALIDVYNTLGGHARRFLDEDADLDKAWRRVFYEACRANGQELPPFDEFLMTHTDWSRTHKQA